ncbi:MAG: thiamine pyrophosphate-requiring protein [Rhizobiales bacterium]|nr:thiamine pyrophosphate-requiring protein [Hyphomicrobiales bacterium]
MAELPADFIPQSAAEAVLVRLKQHGIDYLFANAGTDFAPVIETYARNQQTELPVPMPVTAPHETAAVAMAHGYYLATGKPQAVMVHVNVGLANALMGVINAASDNIPIFMMAGRTPSTEGARLGARSLPIHWGQDMRDQSSIVREFVKWEYELKSPEQAADLIDRGYAIAMSEPRGPVYLGLPREPLGGDWPKDTPLGPPRHAASSPPAPDPEALETAADLIAAAKKPLIIAQRGDPEGALSQALDVFCDRYAIPVAEFWPSCNLIASNHPMHVGFDPGAMLAEADLVIVLDALVPWIDSGQRPNPDAEVIQIGPDPLFSRVPIRGFRSSLSLTAKPADALTVLSTVIEDRHASLAGNSKQRRRDIAKFTDTRRDAAQAKAESGGGCPMTPAFVSKCLSDTLPDDARIFAELGCDPSVMSFAGGNRYFSHALAGGLGWGLPAALGAALADRDRLAVACIGDGSYMFANPVACHQIAEANALPVLTIVFNNGVWNAVRKTTKMMYPDGKAARMNDMPMSSLEPSPDYAMIAAASRAWSTTIADGKELAAAIAEALKVIATERRQAMIEVMVTQD